MDKKEVFEFILKADQTGGYDLRQSIAKSKDFANQNDWMQEQVEGQLAVDVAQSDQEIFVVSTLAGALVEKIQVFIHNDLLTIKGERISPLKNNPDLIHNECFWGKFSRTVVLPAEVKADLSTAEYKNGVLTIRVPKQHTDAKVPIVVIDD